MQKLHELRLFRITQYTKKEVTFCQLSKIKFFHKMMEPLKQYFGVFLLADDRAGFKCFFLQKVRHGFANTEFSRNGVYTVQLS
jgi:hypothetical protein